MSDPEPLIRRLRAGEMLTTAEVNVLLRACLRAPPGSVILAADYSQVEARALAWAAGDFDALDVFTSGADPYAKLACRLYSIDAEDFDKDLHAQPRDTSKKAELGCGYSMGPAKFTITAEKGGMVWDPPDRCVGGACVNPTCGVVEPDMNGVPFTHGARTIVTTWREVHAPIVEFWRALQDAALDAAAGGHGRAGPYEFAPVGGAVWCMLPSGRPIVYNGMRIEFDRKRRPGLVYHGTEGPERTYGGKLAENVTQAFCRDLLARSLAMAEAEGLWPVLHVHDEIACQVPAHMSEECSERLTEIMTDLPDWAEGFPVAVSVKISERYQK